MYASSQNTAISSSYILFCIWYVFPFLRHHLCAVLSFNSSDLGFQLAPVPSLCMYFPACVLLIQHPTFIQHCVCIPLIHYLPIVANQFFFVVVTSLFFLSTFQMSLVQTAEICKLLKNILLYLYRKFTKKQRSYNLRQNTSYILAIMPKYRQAAKETKPLIVMVNSEKLWKKDRKSVTIICQKPLKLTMYSALRSVTQNLAPSYTGHPFIPSGQLNTRYQRLEPGIRTSECKLYTLSRTKNKTSKTKSVKQLHLTDFSRMFKDDIMDNLSPNPLQ